MNDEALDALADALLERIVAKLEARDAPDYVGIGSTDESLAFPAISPIPLADDWPDYDEYGGVEAEPEPERPRASFPRPPRPQAQPVRGIETELAVGDVAPISQPEPHHGATIGGHSTRPPDNVLAQWFDRDVAGPRAYTVAVEDMAKVG